MGKLELTVKPNSQEIVMTRVFDAPRERVFEAYVNADQVEKWWGGKLFKTTIDKFDARTGGEWRMVQTDDNGEYAFHGSFHEVAPHERIIQTFEFEGMPEPGHVALETAKFEDEDGKTRVTTTSVFQSVTDRDGMIEAGMETGASSAWDALAEMVENGQ
jgi:uncharacterized protein YndB with AHSA1/START domain